MRFAEQGFSCAEKSCLENAGLLGERVFMRMGFKSLTTRQGCAAADHRSTASTAACNAASSWRRCYFDDHTATGRRWYPRDAKPLS
jgi:hypothetical protein